MIAAPQLLHRTSCVRTKRVLARRLLRRTDPMMSNGDIMNSSLTIGGGATYFFNAGHAAQLATSLPGVNR